MRRDLPSTPTRRHRNARTALVAATLGLLASGCMLSTEINITIAANGSGSSVSLIQYDSDMARLLGPASQFRDELLDAQADGADVRIVPASDLTAPYTEGLSYRAEFADADGLRDVLLDGTFDTAVVRIEDGVLTIDARFDGNDAGDDELFEDMMPRATAIITIDVQGDITSSNADTVSGSTAVWEFDITRDGRLQLTAELGGGFPTLLVAGGAVLLLILAGVGFRATRGRTGPSSEEPDASAGAA